MSRAPEKQTPNPIYPKPETQKLRLEGLGFRGSGLEGYRVQGCRLWTLNPCRAVGVQSVRPVLPPLLPRHPKAKPDTKPNPNPKPLQTLNLSTMLTSAWLANLTRVSFVSVRVLLGVI